MKEHDEHIVYGKSPIDGPLEGMRRINIEAAKIARANKAEAASRRAVEYGEPEQEGIEHDD